MSTKLFGLAVVVAGLCLAGAKPADAGYGCTWMKVDGSCWGDVCPQKKVCGYLINGGTAVAPSNRGYCRAHPYARQCMWRR